MNEPLVRAVLTVIINDQAYLYAEIQSMRYEDKMGFPPDPDLFERWQDEWKEESQRMSEKLLEEVVLDEIVWEDEDE